MRRFPLRRADDPFHDWSSKHCSPTTQKMYMKWHVQLTIYLNFRCVLKINISLENYHTFLWIQINIFFYLEELLWFCSFFFLLPLFFRYSRITIFDKSYFRKVSKDRFRIEKLRCLLLVRDNGRSRIWRKRVRPSKSRARRRSCGTIRHRGGPWGYAML